jgi:hypothetical protein
MASCMTITIIHNKKTICPYYAIGKCKFGSSCTKIHVDKNKICQKFLNNSCKFGNSCWYSHNTGNDEIYIPDFEEDEETIYPPDFEEISN